MITKDLKVSQQCKQAYAKASRMLGVINRSIKSKDTDILLSQYKSLVRPHLEYCIPWEKTKLQNIGYGPPPQPVSVDGHSVEVTDKFVYLGSTVDSTGYSSTDIL